MNTFMLLPGGAESEGSLTGLTEQPRRAGRRDGYRGGSTKQDGRANDVDNTAVDNDAELDYLR